MEIIRDIFIENLETIPRILDRCRQFLLRKALRIGTLKRIYSRTSARLGIAFSVLCVAYLPLALRFPKVILVFGPLVFGYAHLVASYRFAPKKLINQNKTFQRRHMFLFFLLTALVAIYYFDFGFQMFDKIPRGVFEIVVATFILLIVEFRFKPRAILYSLISLSILLYISHLAWIEPLSFIGTALIVHNWVAFVYWIISAKRMDERITAVLATIVFAIIHYLVLTGAMDTWISMKSGESFFTSEVENIGWIITPWSNDPMIWYRAATLYAFGLSLHYFIWLKAIPESLHKFQCPPSFRESLRLLRNDLGDKLLIVFGALSTLGIAIWCISFDIGSRLFFSVAALHGWLELALLVGILSSKCLSYPKR